MLLSCVSHCVDLSIVSSHCHVCHRAGSVSLWYSRTNILFWNCNRAPVLSARMQIEATACLYKTQISWWQHAFLYKPQTSWWVFFKTQDPVKAIYKGPADCLLRLCRGIPLLHIGVCNLVWYCDVWLRYCKGHRATISITEFDYDCPQFCRSCKYQKDSICVMCRAQGAWGVLMWL